MSNRPFDFSGATVLVIGGASGLGRAIAEGLATHGARVAIAARQLDKARAVADQIARQTGGVVDACSADLTSEASMVALGAFIDNTFTGQLNIAVNSGGTNIRNPIDDISLAEFETVQRTNITGAFLFARTVHSYLRKAGWGRLIHITSIFSSRSFPGRTSYASSKGALLQLTRTLALEWATEGITVNAISPGPIATEMMKPVMEDPRRAEQFLRRIPMNRFGEPREIATAALFLASPASSFVTGADVVVDGGWMSA
jgi:NAD(P)-dependent dehydrogenase (short-subunit alcohol dehydrogenase family)